MRDELDFLATMEKSSEKRRWETPIRHAMPTELNYTVTGDACLTRCGAFCPELKFWYHAQWPPEVVPQTIKFMKKRSLNLI